MSIPYGSIRIFRSSVLVWVIGFVLSAYGSLDALNFMGRSPVYLPPGVFKYATHALAMLPKSLGDVLVLLIVPVLVLLCVHDLVRGSRWWTAFFIWFFYVNLMDRAWLAGSGGQQLIANLLFWNILLPCGSGSDQGTGSWRSIIGHSAFWIVRFQLLLAYTATGLHKLTGVHWVDGTALGIVATDPAFGPMWVAEDPSIAALITWAVLLFQITFPLAVWLRSTRYVWLCIGCLFHLSTAVWMDIPEMGMAFIAAYPIWLYSTDSERVLGTIRHFKRRLVHSMPSPLEGR